MSLIKWTLALAGAAMGVRHMSERHRRRLAGGADAPDTAMPDDAADRFETTVTRAPRTDRDSLSATGSGVAGGSVGSSIGSSVGSSPGLTPGSGSSAGRTDDLLAPGSDDEPGSSSGRP